ncbi:energy transducer TonB [Psychrobacter aquaticus]|nr:energy transducer TonB [Psychrobacter aquaticus]
MMPNFFTRPLTTCVTMLVVVLHGIIAWAMVSIDKPITAVPKNKPSIIHLELITLASTPAKIQSSTNNPPTVPQPKPLIKKPSQPNIQPTEPIKKAETTETVTVSDSVEPLKTVVEQKQTTPITSTTSVKEDFEVERKPVNPSSDQKLIIAESKNIVASKKTVNTSDAKEETEDDLSAMIRAVTAQFNREQAIQQRAARNQANRKLMEQEQWQAQAANEAVGKMLALAAAQAEQQTTDQTDLDNKVNENDVDAPFLAEDGSWMDGQEPTTSVPSLVWRNINTRLGDVFIVMLELHVNKEGYITEVQLLESSGSPIIDAIATTQVRAGQLNPLKQNGIEVDAIVPMSLVYERP